MIYNQLWRQVKEGWACDIQRVLKVCPAVWLCCHARLMAGRKWPQTYDGYLGLIRKRAALSLMGAGTFAKILPDTSQTREREGIDENLRQGAGAHRPVRRQWSGRGTAERSRHDARRKCTKPQAKASKLASLPRIRTRSPAGTAFTRCALLQLVQYSTWPAAGVQRSRAAG